MIREYSIHDKKALLSILQCNTPEYFDPKEIDDYEYYLDQELEDYFVIEENSKVLGGAGINYFPELKMARLSWDLLHPDCQGSGLGRLLILHRLRIIQAKNIFEYVEVRTSQKAFGFYGRFGFKLVETSSDFWGEGLDLYLMHLNFENYESGSAGNK